MSVQSGGPFEKGLNLLGLGIEGIPGVDVLSDPNVQELINDPNLDIDELFQLLANIPSSGRFSLIPDSLAANLALPLLFPEIYASMKDHYGDSWAKNPYGEPRYGTAQLKFDWPYINRELKTSDTHQAGADNELKIAILREAFIKTAELAAEGYDLEEFDWSGYLPKSKPSKWKKRLAFVLKR